ncbi:MAG: alpha-glucan family phosphorylase [Candidatus Latescibacterota bacterium]|jgi:starch phosphorylase
MKPLFRLHVLPDLPPGLAPLWDLAYNLWWTWNQDAARIFQRLDPRAWVDCQRNPLRLLCGLSPERLRQLGEDEELCRGITEVTARLDHDRSRIAWFDQHHRDSGLQIAYFSAEFGLTESLLIYSGGLGILAGDHLKSASDLGLPLVGVGLLYHQGYFHQALNPDGWQVERYPETDLDYMPIRPVLNAAGEPLTVEVPYPQGPVRARLWQVQVGRVPLYLLDANLEENRPEDREITARLYGGEREMRIRQEMLLGIGGTRALEALGIRPTLCHMNEGHSAFQALERIRVLMHGHGLSFAAAVAATRVGNVFTTHTPVAAGNDWFHPELVETWMGPYREQLGLSQEEFLRLGRVDPGSQTGDFCLTALAFRLSGQANGVSRLHGEVSRRMWTNLWPPLDRSEVPIGSVTNGVHTQTWASPETAELYDRYLGPAWRLPNGGDAVWSKVHLIPDAELWASHQARRRRLTEFARSHLVTQLIGQGLSRERTDQTLRGLNPQALTIGFARRFATYKRGDLIFRNLNRLAALFSDPERPIQILFAGKAHPHDNPGKELVRKIVHLARQEPFAGKVFFLQNYDMHVARFLVQGCDVWLNNPRRPQEASGTSGMKAAVNGVPSVSVLDGWWAEACELHSGWTIGGGEEYEDVGYQDEVESNALYDLLESEVVPLFYDRDAEGLPRGWIRRMKETIAALVPVFSTHRMVREYVETIYLPGQRRWVHLNRDWQRAERLAHWKATIRDRWAQVRIEHVEIRPPSPLRVGMSVPVTVLAQLGEVRPEEVRVELYLGRLTAQHEVQEAASVALVHHGEQGDGVHRFDAEYTCTSSGSLGCTVRVIPSHPDLENPLELGLVRWAQA